MKIKALLLSLLILLSSCLFLSSCSKTILEKYKDKKLKVGEVQLVEYTQKAVSNYKTAYSSVKNLDTYTLKTNLSFIIPDSEIRVSFAGNVKNDHGSYTSNDLAVALAGIKFLSATCNANTDDKMTLVLKVNGETSNVDLPFNFAKIGGVVYPILTEEMLAKGELISDNPQIIKFALSANEAQVLYGDVFKFLNETLSDVELPFDNVFDVEFKGCTIFATVKGGTVTSVESSILVNSGSNDLTFEFVGELK